MRRWLVERLPYWLQMTLLWLAPQPPEPPETRWHATAHPEGDATLTVLFTPTASKVSWDRFHVVPVLRTERAVVVLDIRSKGGVIPLSPAVSEARLANAFEAVYVVTVRTCVRWEDAQPGRPEPMTCVSMARRLAGITTPGVFTPHQLLDALWRLRDER